MGVPTKPCPASSSAPWPLALLPTGRGQVLAPPGIWALAGGSSAAKELKPPWKLPRNDLIKDFRATYSRVKANNSRPTIITRWSSPVIIAASPPPFPPPSPDPLLWSCLCKLLVAGEGQGLSPQLGQEGLRMGPRGEAWDSQISVAEYLMKPARFIWLACRFLFLCQ